MQGMRQSHTSPWEILEGLEHIKSNHHGKRTVFASECILLSRHKSLYTSAMVSSVDLLVLEVEIHTCTDEGIGVLLVTCNRRLI